MTVVEIVLGIILCILAVALTVCVMLQAGKEKSLSGSIAGAGGESFFGKNKGKTNEKKLSLATTIITIVFAVVVIATFVVTSVIH